MIRLFHAYFPGRTLVLGASELVLVTLAFLVATTVRFGGDAELVLIYERGLLKVGLVAGVIMLCMYQFDLYDTLVLNNRREIITRLTQVLGGSTLVLALVYYAFPTTRLNRAVFLLGLILVPLFLSFWRELFFRVTRALQLVQRGLLLGGGSLAAALAQEIKQRPELGVELVGYADVPGQAASMNGLPCLGEPRALLDLVRWEKVGQVIVAMADRRGKLPLDELLALKTHGVEVQDGAEAYEKVTGRIPLDSLRPSWLIFSSGFQQTRLQAFYKRTFSLLGSLIALVVFLPVMAIIALAIKLDSAGPVIFRQQRVGKEGKIFTLFKFRSMCHPADPDGQPKPAQENDARFTRVGRWLRRTRLDELPQLYNVLKGDMDLVGPRPFPPNLEAEYACQIPFYAQRWSVKPGATGWAQVHRGYCTSLEENAEKLSYDLFYIKNMSPGLDLLILFKTAKILLWGRGAR